MNKVILTGRLTKNPELRKTNTDVSVVQFTIAVNRRYTDASGNRPADFISCVAWRQQADNLANYMHQGSLIAVEGQIQTRNYQDSNGQTRYITEVICDNIEFLQPKGSSGTSGYHDVNNYDIPPQNNRNNNVDVFDDLQNADTTEESESQDVFSSIKNKNVSDEDLPF